MHLVAYNLMREVTAEAARAARTLPCRIRFKGTLQTVNQFLPILLTQITTPNGINALLSSISVHAVGHRPNRYEPRVRKRRPKSYPLMTKPRAASKNSTTA